MLYDSKIIEDYKEIILSIMHHDNIPNDDQMYPLKLVEQHKLYVTHENQKIGFSQPYNLNNYVSYLDSHMQNHLILVNLIGRLSTKINEDLRCHFDIKVILMYREPIQR